MTWADKVVIAAGLALVVALYAAFWTGNEAGEEVRVLVDGHERERLSLSQDRHLDIDGVRGPSTVEIKDGRVRFIASPCQGKQCIHSGWLNHSGEFAACLPNRVSLYVVGGEARFDTINF